MKERMKEAGVEEVGEGELGQGRTQDEGKEER